MGKEGWNILNNCLTMINVQESGGRENFVNIGKFKNMSPCSRDTAAAVGIVVAYTPGKDAGEERVGLACHCRQADPCPECYPLVRG